MPHGDEHNEAELADRRLIAKEPLVVDVVEKLHLRQFPESDSSMETLRLLANSYKHAPHGGPDNDLLKHLKEHLKFRRRRKYASLPESHRLREGLALSLGLGKDTDYCDIAEEFVGLADRFLGKVK